MAIINSSRFINSVMLPLSSCGTNPFAFRVIRKKVCWRMTTNRLPNHVTPTKGISDCVRCLRHHKHLGQRCARSAHFARVWQKIFRFFCTFILKPANCSKGLCFAIGKTLFWRMILFKRYKNPRPNGWGSMGVGFYCCLFM